MNVRTGAGIVTMMVFASAAGCGGGDQKAGAGAPFRALTEEILQDLYRRHPTTATYLGVHTQDGRLEDYSAAAVADEARAARAFRERLTTIDPASLSLDDQIDRELLLRSIDGTLLQLETIRPWARDPDSYPSGLTNTAYVMIKRSFAPLEERMRLLTARMEAMPAAFDEARRNLDNPPRIYTEIALEQVDGNRGFFESAVREAFASVKDPALRVPFDRALEGVLQAFTGYKHWMQDDLLKRSNGSYAYGVETYRKRLSADEMIDTPLDELLAMAERDLRANQKAFAEAARRIDPSRTPAQVVDSLSADHPPASDLLATTQRELDSLASFLRDKAIVTVPEAPAVRVEETPPFLRATTSASMDIPGPFETVATEAYYSMTLPDPAWPAADREDFMRQWYYPAITNVSVHEVWPGHYLQFLYAKSLPSNVRRVFGAYSNAEGWAHYVEQMVIDEGLHADDPRYRLAQLQDALLRDVRFIVGIRMHTEGMTMEAAEKMFEEEGYQTKSTAKSETKRGTSDATYGYYTMGKLMILAMRDEYKAKLGSAYSLRRFHDAFIKVGPAPLPLVRRVLLAESGS